MALASVTAIERGATDDLLNDIVARLSAEGVRVVGALRASQAGDVQQHCESALQLLPDGPVIRITQDLGSGSAACRMDAGALEDAAGLVATRLAADGADLVVLNKFGLSEAEGRGFRALIAEAMGRGIPVLTGLSDVHRAAFERFAGGMATTLSPEKDAVLDWCREAVGAALQESPRA